MQEIGRNQGWLSFFCLGDWIDNSDNALIKLKYNGCQEIKRTESTRPSSSSKLEAQLPFISVWTHFSVWLAPLCCRGNGNIRFLCLSSHCGCQIWAAYKAIRYYRNAASQVQLSEMLTLCVWGRNVGICDLNASFSTPTPESDAQGPRATPWETRRASY